MSETKHSAGPWHVGSLPPAGWRYICDPSGEAIAAVAEWNENGDLHLEFPNAKANAELIVRAVNSHADLLAACIEAERHHQGHHSEVGKMLRAAIEKAQGGRS